MKNFNLTRKNVKGFTLIELIVVIAIIGVLAAILIPSMGGFVTNSKITKADANAKLVMNAASAWIQQATIDGTAIDAGDTYVCDGDDATAGKATTNTCDLEDGLGTTFKGYWQFAVNASGTAIDWAVWCQSTDEFSAAGTIDLDDFKKADQKTDAKAGAVVGYAG